MSSPLLFFIFIIVIDLVLKSAKDKKRNEQSRQKKTQEMQRQPEKPKPMQNLKRVLTSNKTTATTVKEVKVGRGPERSPWDDDISKKNISESIKPVVNEVEDKESNFKRDILMGIIFSEILSEPKSIQNQKRSS